MRGPLGNARYARWPVQPLSSSPRQKQPTAVSINFTTLSFLSSAQSPCLFLPLRSFNHRLVCVICTMSYIADQWRLWTTITRLRSMEGHYCLSVCLSVCLSFSFSLSHTHTLNSIQFNSVKLNLIQFKGSSITMTQISFAIISHT